MSNDPKPKQQIVCDKCGRKAVGRDETRTFHHPGSSTPRRDYCCSCLDAMPKVQQWHPRKPKPVAVLNLAQAEERIAELTPPVNTRLPAGVTRPPVDVPKALAKGAEIAAGAFTFCKPGAHGKAVAK